MSDWGTSGERVGRVSVITDLNRLGNNKLQPKKGSYVLCVEHTGDHFFNYVPLLRNGHYWRALCDEEFGAYVFGTPVNLEFSKQEFHKLLAGMAVFKHGAIKRLCDNFNYPYGRCTLPWKHRGKHSNNVSVWEA